MSHTVRLSAETEQNREHTYQHYLERTLQGAHRWFAAYEQAIRDLTKDPERYAVAPENQHYQVKLQQINFGTKPSRPTHRLLYYLDGETIYVVTLRHLHQKNWPSINPPA